MTGSAGGTIDVAGGAADPVNGTPGGQGRFLLGTNAAGAFSGTVTPNATATISGPVTANPFVSGNPSTPYLPDLAGGAEGYGIATDTALDLPDLIDTAPAGAAAALVMSSGNTAGFAEQYPGYDLLLLVNLTDQSLTSPQLGVGSPGFESTLLEGGYENDPAFGGSGAKSLSQLGAYQIYATLVPAGSADVNATFVYQGKNYGADAVSILPGSTYYVNQSGSFDVAPAGNLAATEGSNAVFTVATFTRPTQANLGLAYSATIDWGDGSSSAATISAPDANGASTVTGAHTYANAGHETLTVVVDEVISSLITPKTATEAVAVADAPLSGKAVGMMATPQATFNGIVATFTDGNSLAKATDFTAAIDWGDGTSGPGTVSVAKDGFEVSGSHLYASSGTENVVVSVSDVGGSKVTITSSATVAPSSIDASGATVSATEGAAFNGVVATFTRGDGSAPALDFTAKIDWGDAQTSAATVTESGTTYSIAGSHTYADTGTFVVATTVSGGGGSTVAKGAANVVAPGLTADDRTYVIGSGTVNVAAGNGLLTGDTGPSQLSVTAETVTGAEGGTFVINADGSFTYRSPANFPGYDSVQFTVTDASGDKATQTVTVLSQHASVVWKFYESVLNRTPDPAGLQYWTNYFNNGGNTGDMAFGFFESDELLDKVLANY
ncbi:MAG: hypothetical protein B7Z73_12740 [Planctomycetia bacterium 21-64-5]|nr:MAG: hypothetical protein B7Z73_12740 [Planctomycetia bacterium 21-64-5]